MKVVIIGGTGLIGSKLVALLRTHGHEAVAASPSVGIDALTGKGLAAAMQGAAVVVDVSNPPSFAGDASLQFFRTSTRNLLEHEARAGVGHHVALSVVGTQRLSESDYFRGKLAQEDAIKASAIPYSIVQATQFFEFVQSITNAAMRGERAHVAPLLLQPIAAEEVASTLYRVATAAPRRGTLEIAGPEVLRQDELVQKQLRALRDAREIVLDPELSYFGSPVAERTLLPDVGAELGTIRFDAWLQNAVSER